jgi:uncharacterized protein
MNFTRNYVAPEHSFFLFGPRGVGKSTWIREASKPSFVFDLLKQETFLKLQRNTSLLEAQTAHLQKGELILIDEIQKLPELLDEVHRLIENQHLKFALTGSSARKLKKSGINLLAGRALTRKMFPFSVFETNDFFTIDQLLKLGSLPVVLKDLTYSEEVLSSYVFTYLQEEIKEEALVRRVDEFSRFLQICAQLNGSILNLESVSRESGKSSKTIQSWYQILEDTLLLHRVDAYRPGFKVRESAHPKYFWFDCGVARVAAGLSSKEVDGFWNGFAFETMVLRELLTYFERHQKKHKIFYYCIPGAGEIDFVVETRVKTLNRPQQLITIEVKLSQKWKTEFETPSRQMQKSAPQCVQKMIGVYLGEDRLTFANFEVFPFKTFVKAMYDQEIFD